jgi:hypothetical protein
LSSCETDTDVFFFFAIARPPFLIVRSPSLFAGPIVLSFFLLSNEYIKEKSQMEDEMPQRRNVVA